MSEMFVVGAEPASPEQGQQYASYYASIATEPLDPPPVTGELPAAHRYALRQDVGDGVVDVLQTPAHLRVVRYDTCFRVPHHLGYSFGADRFELEICLGGRMEIEERRAGRGEVTSGRVSVSPPRETRGVVSFPAGERYRAVSVSGRLRDFASCLGSLAPDEYRGMLNRASRDSDGHYLGAVPRQKKLLDGGREIYHWLSEVCDTPRAPGPGDMLRLEAQVMSALSLLLPENEGLHAECSPRMDEFERAKIRRIPDLLWTLRHDLPTIPQLARRLCMSPKRLGGLHYEEFGTTIIEGHRRRCIDQAADLLDRTDWTVEHIAHECGYVSASNFIYAFRRRRGCTPGTYRSHALHTVRDAAPHP
ncbi:hypothetical protein BJF89_12835 [Corynebacterium sp. CNJ-954]|uniref:helix-turn-helix transcriptional regulator n=1 Tax=Corynebacterium sp. CNJ-954 TaxID=1904962 RepID=UPI000960D12C|nr:AraC family transcriptional regulator [Corynebacterium sp. CNJ-954]OLT55990.1 hypothetical protein BJF89_12835 [Corynebacterium sp. CNJ-954]